MSHGNDVILLNMPYTAPERPSLALGLLHNYIEAFGHKVSARYASLEFAVKIGVDRYALIDASEHEHMIGEWTFSQAAFGSGHSDDERYFALLTDIPAQQHQSLLEVRQLAGEFILELATQVVEQQPKIVGCTSTFQQNCASLALLRQIKKLDPQIITMMGGANCEGVSGQTISRNFDWVDYVFSGECDEVIGDFVDKLIKGTHFGPHNLPYGLIAQNNSAQNLQSIIKDSPSKPPRATVTDMSKVGSPNYHDYFDAIKKLDLEQYFTPGLLLETSRGCWWGAKRHCTFCGLNGHGMEYRAKSADAMIEELEQLSAEYGLNKFEVVDNILPMEYVDTVLPRLAQGPDYAIFYETKANLRKAQIKQLAKAGVKWIQPGFESLDDEFLRLIKKGTTAVQNIAALKFSRESGVRVSWNLLCAAPGESTEYYGESAQLLPLISHLQPPYQFLSKIRFVRYSPYHSNADEYGLKLTACPAYSFIYPLNIEQLNDLAYFFVDSSKHATLTDEQQQGFDLLQGKLHEWRALFWGGNTPPSLYMMDDGNIIKILDTRPVATQIVHLLSGLAATIYRACNEPVSVPRLFERMADIDQDELTTTLDSLVANKLLLKVSHCYFSLALEGDIPAMPGDKEHPGGFLFS
jgi:ribosomal peptide maturation radical SAM protein 1